MRAIRAGVVEAVRVGSEAFDEHDADASFDAAVMAVASGAGSAAFRSVLDGSLAAIAILDPQLRYLYVNPSYAEIAGAPAGALVGTALGEKDADAPLAPDDVVRQVMSDGRARKAAVTDRAAAAPGSDERSWHGAYHRLESGGKTVGVVCVLLEAPPAPHPPDDLVRARARLRLINQAAERIGTTLDADDTCRQLAHFLSPRLADFAAVDLPPRRTGHRQDTAGRSTSPTAPRSSSRPRGPAQHSRPLPHQRHRGILAGFPRLPLLAGGASRHPEPHPRRR